MSTATDRLTQSIKDLTSRRLRIEGAKTGPLAIDELLRRADVIITANATGTTDVDGFPPNSSMAGDPGKNRYPLPDEDSELGHLGSDRGIWCLQHITAAEHPKQDRYCHTAGEALAGVPCNLDRSQS